MRKKVFGLTLGAILLFNFNGCSEKDVAASKPLNEITASVLSDSGISFPEMVEVGEENFSFKYGLSSEAYSEYSVWWAGSGGDADEICIIKAVDKNKVKDAVEDRLDSQKTVFKDYVEEEYNKLCETKVKTKGDYIYWICSDDNEKAEEIVLSYFE